MDWGLVLEAAKLAAPYLSKAAQGATQGRQTQAVLQGNQDTLRGDNYRTQQNAEMQAGQLDLDRKGFTEGARLNRAKQMAIADALMGYKPTQINVPGIQTANVSGGFGGLSGDSRQGLNELKKQALAAMLAGDKFSGGKVLPREGVTSLPQAGGWEKAAGILGHAGNLANIGGQAIANRQPTFVPPQVGLNAGLTGLPGEEMPMPEAPSYLNAQNGAQGLNPELFRQLFRG